MSISPRPPAGAAAACVTPHPVSGGTHTPGLGPYALRLHEVGMVKSSPQKIIAQGTDWRFLDELKRELKG